MIFVSNTKTTAPRVYKTSLQEKVYNRGCGQKTGLPRTPKGAGSLCILRTKSTSHYRFITSAVL